MEYGGAVEQAVNSLEEVAKAHAEYLGIKHPDHHQKFVKLLAADREAAFGEAVVFSLLKTYFRVRPEPADVPGTGGVDFVCFKGEPKSSSSRLLPSNLKQSLLIRKFLRRLKMVEARFR